ncbi:unnamed protein product, partial [Prunus brigantina]
LTILKIKKIKNCPNNPMSSSLQNPANVFFLAKPSERRLLRESLLLFSNCSQRALSSLQKPAIPTLLPHNLCIFSTINSQTLAKPNSPPS